MNDLRIGLYDPAYEARARGLVRAALERQGLEVLLERLVPVDPSALRPAAVAYQLPIVQWVFVAPADRTRGDVDRAANAALLEIEQSGYERPELAGLYPLSLSARTQVLKGRAPAIATPPTGRPTPRCWRSSSAGTRVPRSPASTRSR